LKPSQAYSDLIRNWVGWGADLATRSPAVPQTRFRREGLDLR
jgi:hypothetical protein